MTEADKELIKQISTRAFTVSMDLRNVKTRLDLIRCGREVADVTYDLLALLKQEEVEYMNNPTEDDTL